MDTNTFAENIKKKYPEYANMDNSTLVGKIVAKYPVYKSQITDYSTPIQKGFGQRITESIKERGANFNEEITDTTQNPIVGGLKAAAQGFGAIADVGEQAIRSSKIGGKVLDTVQDTIGKGVNYVADKVSNIPLVQEAAMSGQTQGLEDTLEGVAATGEIAGTIAGANETGNLLNNLGKNVKGVVNRISKLDTNFTPPGGSTGIVKATNDIIKDITPKAADLRDRSVAKALRLAPVEDISVIKQATGNDIGEFMSRYDLIKDTAEETAESLKKFQRENFDLTRDAISLVDERFRFEDIPEIETTVDFLMEDLAKRRSPEYMDALERLTRIKATGDFDLLDAQYVKELFDDVESIYKRSGEVRDALNAQDKAQTITPVRRFIEDRVQEVYPEVNIRGLNNNVQTSRAILDAVVKRAPKADTASMFQLGDFAVLGLGNQLTPGIGFAALFGKKFIESAPLQLRMAKYWAGKTKDITEGMTSAQLKEARTLITRELKEAIEQGEDVFIPKLEEAKSQLDSAVKVQSKKAQR